MKRMVLLVMLGCCISSLVYAAKAVVISVEGAVSVLSARSGAWAGAYPGCPLEESDSVRTGARSGAGILFDDGTRITLTEHTTVGLAALAAAERVVFQESGSIRCAVKKLLPGHRFSVKTPVSVCSVRGTVFSVTVKDRDTAIVRVFEGSVGVVTLAGEEVELRPREKISVLRDMPLAPVEPFDPADRREARREERLAARSEAVREVGVTMTREQMQRVAADEQRYAEYQQGKAVVDAFGHRVRIEEYIVRPHPDTFKMVVLNERDHRFDYFTWQVQFNRELPTDLTVATRWLGWTSGAVQPEYFTVCDEKSAGNTVDEVRWGFTGGHLALTDGRYAHWYNNYYFDIRTVDNGVPVLREKIAYRPRAGVTDVVGWDDVEYIVGGNTAHPLDAAGFDAWWAANIRTVAGTAGGFAYTDGSYREQYYLVDNDGNEATPADLLSLRSGGRFNEEHLLRWNFQNVYSGSDFNGPEGKVDLVVEPRIFIDAGIVQVNRRVN